MATNGLYLVGLGLGDAMDVSLKGLELIKRADTVFLEDYTSILTDCSLDDLEVLYGSKVEALDRVAVEDGAVILDAAGKGVCAFLVVGDPLCATTHTDLMLRARELRLEVHIIHGASILTAAPSLLGLQHYKFGRTTTLAYPEGDYFPTSPYDVIADNLERGLHTMVLLDIQTDRSRYMSAKEGLNLLLEMESRVGKGSLDPDTLVCVVARAGSAEPFVRCDTLGALKHMEMCGPPHTLIIPGKLHFLEAEALVELASAPESILE